MNNLVAHMRTSAEAGNADAQFNLAVMLGNGFGTQREEALLWLRKAAEAGLCRAQCKLAVMCAEGDTSDGQEEACAWFLIALDNQSGGGRQGARDGYEKVVRLLSPEQLERARCGAQAWLAEYRMLHGSRSEEDRRPSWEKLQKARGPQQ